MPKRRTKHKTPKFKLLLDENLPPRQSFRRLNSRFLIKHIVHDYQIPGALDLDVYKLAVKEHRLIITFNDKDFRNLAGKSKFAGIIGVSNNLSYEQIDVKLTSLLTRSTHGQLFGKFTYISN